MMPEISLNILDIAQNSVKAGAKLVLIAVQADQTSDTLTVIIEDDGCGMSEEQLKAVTDPFFTTRTTRKVGLGVPFFKLAAELAGGSFDIASEKGKGTKVTAIFGLSNIDRMPLGDMCGTMHTLITMNGDIDFVFDYHVDDKGFVLDTREFRSVLEGVPFNVPEVSQYIKEYLEENIQQTNNGKEI